MVGECGVDSSDFGQGPAISFCEYCNESSYPMNDSKFLTNWATFGFLNTELVGMQLRPFSYYRSSPFI